MTTFSFDTITPAQVMTLDSSDIVEFTGGPARDASVIFGLVNGTSTITISFLGHSVVFGGEVIGVSANLGLQFPDGSHLLIGGPRNEAYDGGPNDDALFGNDGTDTLAGHGGSNLLQGNQGNDVLSAEAGADTMFGGQGDDQIVTGLGVAGQAGDFAQGNKGDDPVTGGGGADTLLGGQGNDLLQGGQGADFLSGDRGDDTMTGGAGADIFHAVADGSIDRVTDFHVEEGDRIQVDPGVTFQTTQVGADTIVSFAGGGQIVLVGVQMSSLHGDWIFGA